MSRSDLSDDISLCLIDRCDHLWACLQREYIDVRWSLLSLPLSELSATAPPSATEEILFQLSIAMGRLVYLRYETMCHLDDPQVFIPHIIATLIYAGSNNRTQLAEATTILLRHFVVLTSHSAEVLHKCAFSNEKGGIQQQHPVHHVLVNMAAASLVPTTLSSYVASVSAVDILFRMSSMHPHLPSGGSLRQRGRIPMWPLPRGPGVVAQHELSRLIALLTIAPKNRAVLIGRVAQTLDVLIRVVEGSDRDMILHGVILFALRTIISEGSSVSANVPASMVAKEK